MSNHWVGHVNPDIYNIDELGSAIDIKQNSKVIISSEKRQVFAKRDGNREWATIFKTSSASEGRDIPPFLIIKGKISTSRLTISQDESNQPSSESIVTPIVCVQ
jgi:hypothetical protein